MKCTKILVKMCHVARKNSIKTKQGQQGHQIAVMNTQAGPSFNYKQMSTTQILSQQTGQLTEIVL